MSKDGRRKFLRAKNAKCTEAGTEALAGQADVRGIDESTFCLIRNEISHDAAHSCVDLVHVAAVRNNLFDGDVYTDGDKSVMRCDEFGYVVRAATAQEAIPAAIGRDHRRIFAPRLIVIG